MLHRRLAPTLLALLACLLLLAACGSDDDAKSDSDSRDVAAQADDAPEEEEAPPLPSSPEDVKDRVGVASFSLTPEMATCMERAGFTHDAPPTGGLFAWRHPSGARVVVGSGPDVTIGIASEIGTAERPANVEGSIVIAADAKLTAAANACLDS